MDAEPFVPQPRSAAGKERAVNTTLNASGVKERHKRQELVRPVRAPGVVLTEALGGGLPSGADLHPRQISRVN